MPTAAAARRCRCDAADDSAGTGSSLPRQRQPPLPPQRTQAGLACARASCSTKSGSAGVLRRAAGRGKGWVWGRDGVGVGGGGGGADKSGELRAVRPFSGAECLDSHDTPHPHDARRAATCGAGHVRRWRAAALNQAPCAVRQPIPARARHRRARQGPLAPRPGEVSVWGPTHMVGVEGPRKGRGNDALRENCRLGGSARAVPRATLTHPLTSPPPVALH